MRDPTNGAEKPIRDKVQGGARRAALGDVTNRQMNQDLKVQVWYPTYMWYSLETHLVARGKRLIRFLCIRIMLYAKQLLLTRWRAK